MRKYRGSRLLIAEDEVMNREIMVDLLNQMGLLVDVAEDGLEAIELAARNSYELILMDMQMPHLDGLGAARQLRQNGIRVPIIATTANAFAEDKALCFAAGMDDFVAKPVEPQALFATVLKWLERNGEHALVG